jgi:hypothetical protein
MHRDDIPTVVNYLRIRVPGHPLADKYGSLGLHRWLVYRRLGPGPQPCHWCGVAVEWLPGEKWDGVLVVDHVDGNRGNNDESNLVPSCHTCNIRRGRKLTIREGEPTVLLSAGRTRAVEVICHECGSPYLTRRERATTQQFCTRSCQVAVQARQRAVPDDERYVEKRISDGTIVRVRAVERRCETCGTLYLVECGRLKRGNVRFCSHTCGGKASGRHGNHARGGEVGTATLTEADVREMRRLWAGGGITLAALGARFGVTKSGANMVVYRRSWKHVQ